MDHYADAAFCNRIAERFQELMPILVEHRRDNNGETLPHLFIGDVARWFITQHREGNRQRIEEMARWLDDQYPMESEANQNVIDVSFLENLPWPPDHEAEEIAQVLGPRLRKSLKEMQDWRPNSRD